VQAVARGAAQSTPQSIAGSARLLMSLTDRIFLSATQRRLLQGNWSLFVFHKVAPPPPETRDRFEYQTPERFAERLNALRAAGLVPAALDDLPTELNHGAGRFSVTFDDGYAHVIANALPVLRQQNLRAIQFIVAGKLGGQNDWDIAKGDAAERLMDAAQIREWLAAGQTIGSHSLTHPNLRKISRDQAREEISASRKRLEDLFSVPVRHFCYPYGSYDAAIQELVQAAGYLTASTMKHGFNVAGSDIFQLRRVAALSAGELAAKAWHRLRRR
jgi:peptidoglycan/xylan/chitin deacetylase (PgdA/CDA1 family)